MVSTTSEIISQFVINQYKDGNYQTPLIIGINGPQGSGKTTTCEQVVTELSQKLAANVIALSIDDFLLTHNDQEKISRANPGNKLLEFRGLPGTHDIKLGSHILQSICNQLPIQIPHYDKSLHNGRGDRAPTSKWTLISSPIDIVLFEGWSLGFKHLSETCLKHIYESSLKYSSKSHLPSHKLEHLLTVNNFLKEYEREWYPYIDAFIHLDAKDINYAYEWRLQQEHTMRKRGLSGMSDAEVRDFVDRYMPAYELYVPALRDKCLFCSNDWDRDEDMGKLQREEHRMHKERSLRILLDRNRKVIDVFKNVL
ncbi:2033_t:CDS:2 [Ambispora leptoticha]|uniref:2033_t:CDS:1 n=1 Tax=Ambispora leptoticha TaxID=144679 RepID=A0A9N8VGJ8_9GLOM|nr:2033_t:CDS:2 [Ambispora leptoticha]